MRISCPNCQAKFNVKDELLGDKGRKIKCPKCAHVWHQMPAPAEEAAPAPQPAAEPAPAAPNGGDVPMTDEGSGDAEPMETPSGGDVPMTSEPAEQPSLEDIIGMGTDGGEVPMTAEPESTSEENKPRPDQDMDLPPDTGDIDQLFAGGDKKKDEHTDVDDLLDDAEPEPIPEMFSGSPFARQQPKPSRLPIIVGIPVFLLLAVLVAGFFLRDTIESMLPAAKPVLALYDMLPMGGPSLDVQGLDVVIDGHEIDESGPTRALTVRGSVVSATSETKDLPNLKLSTYDAADQVLQEVIAAPPQPTISGGGKVTYAIRLENLADGTHRYTVTFTADPVPGMGEGMGQ